MLYRAVVMSALLSLASGCTLLPPNAKAPPTASATSSPTASPSQSPSASASATASAALVEAASPPFHGGEVAVAYKTVALTTTGGVQPYAWTLGAGALPNGLSLGTDGHVTGTPTKAGHFSFTIVVSDSGGGKASLNGSATIVSALTANFLRACGSAGKCSVEQGCNSACGGFGYQGGGSAPYSYNLTGGSMPTGTYQYGLSLAGKFTTTGTFNFKATLTDGYGATASLSPTFTVFPHISVAGATITCFYPGCGGASNYPPAALAYTGGSGTPSARVSSWKFVCDPSPAGCGVRPAPTVSVAGGSASITVAGSAGGSGYTGSFTLTLTDGSLCAAGTHCSVSATVNVVVQRG